MRLEVIKQINKNLISCPPPRHRAAKILVNNFIIIIIQCNYFYPILIISGCLRFQTISPQKADKLVWINIKIWAVLKVIFCKLKQQFPCNFFVNNFEFLNKYSWDCVIDFNLIIRFIPVFTLFSFFSLQYKYLCFHDNKLIDSNLIINQWFGHFKSFIFAYDIFLLF